MAATEKDRRTQTCAFRRVRLFLVVLGFFGFLTVYAIKVDFSVSMVAIVADKDSEFVDGKDTCKEIWKNSSWQNRHKSSQGEFGWNLQSQSIMLGSFFYGYLATQIPGGLLADKFGAKWIFGIGIVIASVFSLVTPMVVYWGVAPIAVTRIIQGIGEGVTNPAMNTHIARWAPKNERSLFSTFIFGGSSVGTIAAILVAGFLSTESFLGGWPATFYIFGAFGCLWFLFWACLIHEKPADHPCITPEELKYIREGQDDVREKHMKIPWGSIFTSVPVWALALTHFSNAFGFNMMLTELPTFQAHILHFDLRKNAILSCFPYFLQCICAVIASFVADRYRQSKKFEITQIRKSLNSIGFFGPAFCFIIIALFPCNPSAIVSLLCMAMGFNGFVYSGLLATHVDMSPNFAGPLLALTTSVASASGILAPYIVGQISKTGQTVQNWNLIFWITGSVYYLGGVTYYLFCNADPQPWNSENVEKDNRINSDIEMLFVASSPKPSSTHI